MSDNEAIKATAAEDADATYTRHFSDFVSSCGQVGGEVAWTTIAELLDRYNVPVLYRVYAHMVLAHGPSNRLYHAEKPSNMLSGMCAILATSMAAWSCLLSPDGHSRIFLKVSQSTTLGRALLATKGIEAVDGE
ncbi:unnamed protein product [Aureobasidium pullulans]|nr:unnamed protein product [Aureobasidium pullulans]